MHYGSRNLNSRERAIRKGRSRAAVSRSASLANPLEPRPSSPAMITLNLFSGKLERRKAVDSFHRRGPVLFSNFSHRGRGARRPAISRVYEPRSRALYTGARRFQATMKLLAFCPLKNRPFGTTVSHDGLRPARSLSSAFLYPRYSRYRGHWKNIAASRTFEIIHAVLGVSERRRWNG